MSLHTLSRQDKVFRKRLLDWWSSHKREFPWRRSRDPYAILISEVLLHRTRAAQVASVFSEFLLSFPDPAKLAEAEARKVDSHLRSLGLHWRRQLLQRMALEIVNRHHSEIPADVAELTSLSGVGEYIASAVRCFAFGQPEVLLDTNTVRILGRVFGEDVTDNSRRSSRFRELYASLIDTAHPREFNYAMIDLGALICKPSNPKCGVCPEVDLCRFGRENAVTRSIQNPS